MASKSKRATPVPTQEKVSPQPNSQQELHPPQPTTAPGAPSTPHHLPHHLPGLGSQHPAASPLIVPRKQEKEELARLNDRLSLYIQRVKEELESDYKDEGDGGHHRTTVLMQEVTEVRTRYEQQINDLRRQLDESKESRAHVDVDLAKYRGDADEWREKCLKKDAELTDVKKKLSGADAKMASLQARFSEVQAEYKAMEYDRTRTRDENLRLEEKVAMSSKMLDEESSARTNLEEKVLTLRDELAFKAEVHKQLQELRDIATRNEREVTTSNEKLRSERRRNDELAAQLTELDSMKAGYERRIKNLETQLKNQQEDHDDIVRARDKEIDNLNKQLAELMDIKIALDVEIAAYRRLLDCEEMRFKDRTNSTPSSTPVRVSSVSRGTKRMAVDAVEYTTTSAYNITTTNKGNVEINEADPKSGYMRLFNGSEKVVSLGNWQLKHTAGEKEAVFKFHHSMQLKPSAAVTVYSSDSTATHAPPTDLVMKTQKWPSGDSMRTVVINSQGEEVALREMSIKTTKDKQKS